MNNRRFGFCVLVSIVLNLGAQAICRAADEAINFYVSPEGSDQYTGTVAHNNRQRTDGPFATVQRAQDAVRAIRRAAGNKPRPINLILRGGTYWLVRPVILTPDDSGTPESPITYSAYLNEKPVLSAGRPVHGWAKTTFNGHEVWAAKVPQFAGADQMFHEMWVGGHRRVLARSPNKGFFHAGEVPDVEKNTPLQQGQTRFKFLADDLKNCPDAADATVVLMSLWTESHLPVKSINEADHVVEFTRPTVHKMAPDDRYYIEGAAEMLDEPGEWYFDRKTTTLYYFPQPGETMLGSEAIIPWHEQIVRLEGDPAHGAFIENVSFRGITFANCEWDLPRSPPASGTRGGGSGFGQAAVGVPGAVWGVGVRHCLFENCTVSHAGNYGIELAGGCQDNTISYCTLTDLGAGGIKLGQTSIRLADAEQTKHNQVSDCTIADCGNTFPSAVGIWIGQSPDNLISHNDIHNLWYTGISIGWTWGYGNALAGGNVVEFNHVHHIGAPAGSPGPILSDMAGIYTLGAHKGTIIRNNVFHDIAGLRYGGWGIYFDEGTSNILAENNLVYRTTHGGFHQHYGSDNVVRNNIFAFGRDAQIQRSRVEDHLSFTFERNIVYWDHGDLLAGTWPNNVAFDHNIYWHVGGDSGVMFAKQSWEAWRKGGLDAHSRFTDPGFTDPQQGDFKMAAGSSNQAGKFIPFDSKTAGPQPHKP
ncbi:MAG TPA: right-handed parallel beta-helix repeat-containing protein [Tepidisphaeraceae bacterium]|jgi:parallel beta-helix repeat protein